MTVPSDGGYVVIDVETTGFSPARHDRVVEVGLVQVDQAGAIEDHWHTLINPQRDMGATHVHGITAADVLGAPTFREIAPKLLRTVAGRTLVAHNARFDLTFLEAELARAGFPIVAGTPYLCTMEWSSRFLRGTSRKLGDCCRLAGIANQCGHSADADALATAGLLAYFLRAAGERPPWQGVLASAQSYRWPMTDATADVATALVPRKATREAPDAWLDHITSRVERVADPAVESYVDVLERALLDGHLSAHEKRDLLALAEGLGLGRDELGKVHRLYLTALASAAWADGIVTMEEQFTLSQVAASLAISHDVAKQILLDAQGHRAPFDVPTLHLVAGDRVVFTGELSIHRDQWVDRIARLGIEHGAVTRNTRALVAADPDSLSGKAAKARSYGVPIITEIAFDAVITLMEQRRAARARALDE
jgi:DNA polymerase-3 subunit epsilon